ncbi:hypothetical protein [Parvibaculum sp.]|uniref:hypothetical protein n=1 Tax=Parvibaculum sp. TaxID=2024848 RepID=UPI003919DAE6
MRQFCGIDVMKLAEQKMDSAGVFRRSGQEFICRKCGEKRVDHFQIAVVKIGGSHDFLLSGG